MTNRILARTCDTLLDTSSRITTGMRILPEPAPEVVPGSLGALLTGYAGGPVDVDQLAQGVTTAFDLLNASDLRKLKARLAKYCSSGPTNQAGITSTYTGDGDPLTMGQHAAVQQINQVNADFWAKRAAADNAAQQIR
jgi:hypothetical protein